MKPRMITIAIMALGGQGGGVLEDWITTLAEDAGWTAQATSVAGVAQRTGASGPSIARMRSPIEISSDGRANM